jgi:hypothetical protein
MRFKENINTLEYYSLFPIHSFPFPSITRVKKDPKTWQGVTDTPAKDVMAALDYYFANHIYYLNIR